MKNRIFSLDKISESILEEEKKRGIRYSQVIRDALLDYARENNIPFTREQTPEDLLDDALVEMSKETTE